MTKKLEPKTESASPHGLRQWFPAQAWRPRHAAFACVLVFVVATVGFGSYSVHLGQLCSYDLLNYHYYGGYALLNDRLDLDYGPAQIQTYINPLIFVPLYTLAQHFTPTAVGFVYGCENGLAVALLFMIAFRLFNRLGWATRLTLSVICAGLGAYGPVFLATVGSSSSDALLAPFVLLALYILIWMLTSTPPFSSSRFFVCVGASGLLLGALTGVKLVELVYMIGFGAALLFVKGRSRLAAIGIASACFAIGFLVTRGFWMYALWQKFGNPIFPFFNSIFESPYYEPINFADRNFLPTSAGEALAYPVYFLFQNHFTDLARGFRDSRYALVYLLLVVYAARWIRGRLAKAPARPANEASQVAERFLVVFFVASYVTWQSNFSIVRYALPLELLAPLVAMVLVRGLFRKARAFVPACSLVTIAIAIAMHPPDYPRLPWRQQFLKVKAPTFKEPEKIMVVIAHNFPVSYVVPYFQPEIRFLSIKNNMTKPHIKNKFQDELRSTIEQHVGQLFLLARPIDFREDVATLEDYGLAVVDLEGLKVETLHTASGLGLWLLRAADP